MKVGTDEDGVWTEHAPGARMSLPWDELVSVSADVLNIPPDTVLVVVELGHASGHWLEWLSDMDGFDAAVDALSLRLGLAEGWVDRVRGTGESVELWTRGP